MAQISQQCIRSLLLVLLAAVGSGIAYGRSFFTVIDDDAANVKAIEAIKGVADSANIKISFAVVANRLLKNPQVTDSLLSYQQQGFNVCNHSLTHGKEIWLNGDAAAIENEVVRSTHILDSLGFVNHRYLVYPYGKFSPQRQSLIFDIIKDRFALGFNSRGLSNSTDSIDRLYVARFPIRKHENISLVKQRIDEAADRGDWIVFMTHSGIDKDFSPDYLAQIIEYCQSKDMECMTVDEAYKHYVKYLPDKRGYPTYTMASDLYDYLYYHPWAVILTVLIIAAALIGLRHLRFRGNPKSV